MSTCYQIRVDPENYQGVVPKDEGRDNRVESIMRYNLLEVIGHNLSYAVRNSVCIWYLEPTKGEPPY